MAVIRQLVVLQGWSLSEVPLYVEELLQHTKQLASKPINLVLLVCYWQLAGYSSYYVS